MPCVSTRVTEVTWTQLVSASGLPEGELRELVRYGALVPRDPDAPTWTFEARWLVVARTASRLRHDFDLDPHGVSVVLGYVERIEQLEGGTARAARAAGLTAAVRAHARPLGCRPARRDELGLTAREYATLARLATPPRIQAFVNALPANHEPEGETVHSVRGVLRHREAHCIEGALVAACALWIHGEPPLVMHLDCAPSRLPARRRALPPRPRAGAPSPRATARGCAIASPSTGRCASSRCRTSTSIFDKRGRKTLRSYSGAFDLRRIDPSLWVTQRSVVLGGARPAGRAAALSARDRARRPAALARRDAFERRSAQLVEYPRPPRR